MKYFVIIDQGPLLLYAFTPWLNNPSWYPSWPSRNGTRDLALLDGSCRDVSCLFFFFFCFCTCRIMLHLRSLIAYHVLTSLPLRTRSPRMYRNAQQDRGCLVAVESNRWFGKMEGCWPRQLRFLWRKQRPEWRAYSAGFFTSHGQSSIYLQGIEAMTRAGDWAWD